MTIAISTIDPAQRAAHQKRLRELELRAARKGYDVPPAASDAAALYRIPLDRSLDPAVALAFFAHESTYGTAGVAVHSRNWGNLRRGPRALYVANGFAYYRN